MSIRDETCEYGVVHEHDPEYCGCACHDIYRDDGIRFCGWEDDCGCGCHDYSGPCTCWIYDTEPQVVPRRALQTGTSSTN